MQEQLRQVETEALEALEKVKDLRELESLRVKYFGRKGSLTAVMRGMGQLSGEERPIVGKLANEVRTRLTDAFDRVARTLMQREREQKLVEEAVDITLPGRRPQIGKKHPVTQTIDRIQEIFGGMGFHVAEGPEVEHEYYNFDALNTPANHPARDAHDTFYIANEIVLRTHTSPVQVRYMEKQKPPVRIIVPGKAYRFDSDISHTPMFHQVEGLLVDHHVTFSELKGVLYAFVQQMFGEGTRMRFRPHFFPFTEPSAEVDISCTVCDGKGCRLCSQTGWLEILGAGSVDPNVFRYVNYDPEQVTGLAFGMGVDRIATLRFGIPDLRILFENDMRFIQQF